MSKPAPATPDPLLADYLTLQGLGPGTVAKYCALAARWRSVSDVQATLARLSGPDRAAGTVLPALAAARHWCAWRNEPMPEMRVRWQKQRHYAGPRLTRAEAKRYLRACPRSPGRLYARFILETGLRGSSLATISERDCWRFCDAGRYSVPAKGGRLLSAPLTPKATKLLRKLAKAGGFPGETRALRYQWRQTRKGYTGDRADGDKVTLHTFRHVFASDLIRVGAAREAVQAILGHASYASTDRYVHDADVDGAMALLKGR